MSQGHQMDKRSFTKLYHDVADSNAWQKLSKNGQLAYVNLMFCYRGNDWFKCLRNKLKIYMSPKNFTAGIIELEQLCFILAKRYKPLSKKPNEYKFINGWKKIE